MDIEKAEELVRKSYEAMKGSNCLEEQWLKEALQALDEQPICQKPPESEIWAIMKTLEIYGETTNPVSQGFYQGLCLKARQYFDAQRQRIEELEKIIATQDEDITALQNDLFETKKLTDE